MRKIVAFALIGSLALALIPSAALAGDSHAVRNRWAGVAIGAGAVALGSLLLNSLWATPPAAATPPVVSTPPPVAYTPPPVAAYYRSWIPGHYEKHWVPVAERERVWEDGHYENGWWVAGHWEDRVREGGYWTRVWVEEHWR